MKRKMFIAIKSCMFIKITIKHQKHNTLLKKVKYKSKKHTIIRNKLCEWSCGLGKYVESKTTFKSVICMIPVV